MISTEPKSTEPVSTDSASLQNLNDIVLPEVVDWWPLAPGWYLLFGILLIAVSWFGYRSLKRWHNDHYRRAALKELGVLTADIQNQETRDSSLRQIPILLKRTALSAYPRSQVASLSGKDWHVFLNSKLRTPLFTESTAHTLDRISYTRGDLREIDTQAVTTLLLASRQWLKHHRTTALANDSKET